MESKMAKVQVTLKMDTKHTKVNGCKGKSMDMDKSFMRMGRDTLVSGSTAIEKVKVSLSIAIMSNNTRVSGKQIISKASVNSGLKVGFWLMRANGCKVSNMGRELLTHLKAKRCLKVNLC